MKGFHKYKSYLKNTSAVPAVKEANPWKITFSYGEIPRNEVKFI